MMIDGNLLWERDIVADLSKNNYGPGHIVETFSNLPNNLYYSLQHTAERTPNKIALVDNTYKKYTFQELLSECNQFASYLHYRKGICKGDHVGVLMFNGVEFCVAFLSLLRLGAVMVPLPTKYKKDEVLRLAKLADVDTIMCGNEFTSWFSEIYGKQKIINIDNLNKELRTNNWQIFQDTEKHKQKDQLEDYRGGAAEDNAILMFTSGTTSQSKGVILKNYNIMHAVEAYRRVLHINEDDISILATPMYHITGLVALLGLFVHVGGTLYIHKFFDAKRVIEDARRFHFTFIHASPTVFNMLIREGENTSPILSLQSFACGSSNMVKEKLIRLHNWLPHSKFHTVYGLTETTSPATVFPDDAASSEFIGSSGLPIPGTKFKIIDDNGEESTVNEVGEIVVSGSVVLEEYYKVKNTSLQDGWLYTGDLGYFNDKGYLYVVDRKKNMINRGGEKIWCYDVENEIASISGVDDVAVVGIPDDLYGEVAAALIQPNLYSNLEIDTILKILSKRMAKYKIPVKIKLVERIPQTPNGKIDKVTIKKLLTEDK